MKKPNENNQAVPDWMCWLDGELPAEERAAFEQKLENDSALKEDVALAQQLSRLLKEELPAEMAIPHADFFNSQIQVRLAREEAEEKRVAAAAGALGAGWMSWLKMPWLVGAAAALALALGAGVWMRSDSGAVSLADTQVMSTYAPNPKVVVSAFHSAEAEATVLLLEGLDELPADRKVVGWHLHSGEPDPAFGAMRFRGLSGQVEVVMTRDAQNQPRLFTPRS